ncbi:MAG: ROK family protein [Dongiaceae bacterium]
MARSGSAKKGTAAPVLGIDVGGTGIKGAPVDLATGQLAGERLRIPTPHPATPEAVASTVAEIARHFGGTGRLGCTLPAVVRQGVARTAANIDKSWIGTDGVAKLTAATGRPVTLLNDADAAGLAEMRYGAGRGRRGLVAMVTLGTGIGSALFLDGVLVPNSELGHIEIRGRDAEERATDRARVQKDMSWHHWAKRVEEYLGRLEALLWPDLFIVGGGVIKKADKFLPLIKLSTEILPAQLQNEAGIVGAALAAAEAEALAA